MSNVAVAEKAKETETAGQRKVPEIEPGLVEKQSEGFVFSEFFVTLPQGMILDDLKQPEIWKKMQSDVRRALKKFDRMYITDWDQTWLVTAVVAAASMTGASLADIRKCDLPPRNQFLPSSDTHRVTFAGKGYQVVNKSTGLATGPVYASISEAERVMYSKDARRV